MNLWELLAELLKLLGRPSSDEERNAAWRSLVRHLGCAIVLVAGGSVLTGGLAVWVIVLRPLLSR